MPESNLGLCEKCGTQPATIHLCDGSAGTSRGLCEECMAREDSSASTWLEEARSAKCEYCGGSPCGGGTDTLGLITGEPQRFQWMCAPCSLEHHSRCLAEMNKIPKSLPNDQQIEALKQIAEQTKSHMRRFVAMRGN